MALSFFSWRKPSYCVSGPLGGLSTTVTLPEGFDPKTDKCPMVILMHGFMSKKEFFPLPAVASALAKAGIASIRFDFQAHGKSEGRFIDMTLSGEVADARAVWEYARNLPYVTKTAFLGHSQGGVVAGLLAGELENDPAKPVCVVMMAPAAVLKDDALKGQCMNARYDPANPPEYVSVMFHKLGRNFIKEVQKMPIYDISCRYSGKVCLIHGREDKIVPVSYSVRYNELFPDSELHIVEGEGHMMTRKKSETAFAAVAFLKANLV